MFQIVEPTIELHSLCFGQRHSRGSVTEALPELLDKLEPLGGRQLRYLQGRPRHAVTIARAALPLQDSPDTFVRNMRVLPP